MPVPPTRRPGWTPTWRRLVAPLVVALATTLALAGCGQVNATVETSQALADAGVEDAVVTIENDGNLTTITVDYSSGATGLQQLAAEQDRIAEVVWRSAELDLDLIRLDQEGGPPGAEPSRTYDRPELVARFGARPATLERTRTSPWLVSGALLLILFFVLIAVAIGGVVWFLYFRRRRAAAVPPWLSDSGYPGWDGYEPLQPGPPAPPPPPASYPPATPGHPGYPQARGRAGPAPEAQPAAQAPAESWPADDATTRPAGAGGAAPGPGREPPGGPGPRG